MALHAPNNVLSLVICLHKDTYARIRGGAQGQLTERALVSKGVRRGCVPPPTLLCLSINDTVNYLTQIPTDSPSLANTKTPLLLLAGITLLASKTPSGLQKLLTCFNRPLRDRASELF